MKKQTTLLSLRCPRALMAEVDRAAKEMHIPRSRIMTEAVRLFIKDVRRRGGLVVPPYTGKKPL